MPNVLVVDDSPVDRRLVSGLLGKNPYLTVQQVASGQEALSAMEQGLPDLVVTDLMMPEMDGLQLVSNISRRYPLVPVILMTSKGSEEIAVLALEQGASSYVPKAALARDLLETAQRVLSVSGQRRGHERLLGNITRSECCFELTNDCTLIPPLVEYLQEHANYLALCDESDRIRLGVALEEALVNALYHGNLEISPELAERDYKAYRDLVEERSRQSPYCDRKIHLEARMTRSEAVFVIRDEGPGFAQSTISGHLNPSVFDHAAGRGLLLMRTFMDEVVFNDAGNELTLIKRPTPGEVELLVED